MPALLSSEDFDRVWRRLGLALDRKGFTVEERDRSRGTFLFRYRAPSQDTDPGFLSRLFGSKPDADGQIQKYRIIVSDDAQGCWIRVLPDSTRATAKGEIERILDQIQPELR